MSKCLKNTAVGRWTNTIVGRYVTVCAVGFLVNFQPSEPFLTEYITTSIDNGGKGLSEEELSNYVYPVWTWANFLAIIPVGLLAEVIGYRWTVAIGLLMREGTRVVLIWGQGVPWMAAMQGTYGVATAVNAVYYAYVYCIFEQKQYQLATSVIHASYSIGNVLGCALGQVIVSSSTTWQIQNLFFLSWAFTGLGCVAFIFMPAPLRPPRASLFRVAYKHGCKEALQQVRAIYCPGSRRCCDPVDEDSVPVPDITETDVSEEEHPMLASEETEESPSHKQQLVLWWSLWWACAYAANVLAGNFYTTLISASDHTFEAYGLLEAVNQILTALGYVLPILFSLRRHDQRNGATGCAPKTAEWLVATPSWTCSVLLLGLAVAVSGVTRFTSPTGPALATVYAVQVGLSAFAKSFSTAFIASHLIGGRYAVAFSINTFVATGIASLAQILLQLLTVRGTSAANVFIAASLCLGSVRVMSIMFGIILL